MEGLYKFNSGTGTGQSLQLTIITVQYCQRYALIFLFVCMEISYFYFFIFLFFLLDDFYYEDMWFILEGNKENWKNYNLFSLVLPYFTLSQEHLPFFMSLEFSTFCLTLFYCIEIVFEIFLI